MVIQERSDLNGAEIPIDYEEFVRLLCDSTTKRETLIRLPREGRTFESTLKINKSVADDGRLDLELVTVDCRNDATMHWRLVRHLRFKGSQPGSIFEYVLFKDPNCEDLDSLGTFQGSPSITAAGFIMDITRRLENSSEIEF